MTAFFVTGTDTGVGKTRVSCALLHALQRRYARVIGMKPVAAGTELIDGRWANEDVLALRAASSVQVPALYDNPYLLNQPSSPHIAARAEGVDIDIEHIAACFHALRQQAQAVVVEGAGGFIVPLLESNARSSTSADLAVLLHLPVILVVGVRLGCLNHALLTQEAILARGLTLAGWVANRIDPSMIGQDANVDTLRQRLQAPLLADWGWAPQVDAARLTIDLP
ncbi:dethiobiotin synthase [Aquabacterium sp. CECT 9606]|jgi:dethiobiotin synthetase|uniref:dethiobiotin synthase n=1 Tax=Aquabacterium sp. CECT 9606 TaxID=2845822 RepID=UPI001E387A4F|nr:dethiobiotin synthase [Aquabacterium sp. CECT 9606]CAH0348513.1 ATP-dependent dethiobiotin synthetase BioD 1 [Aquabacterium sp. CECT 9606]